MLNNCDPTAKLHRYCFGFAFVHNTTLETEGALVVVTLLLIVGFCRK